MTIPSFPTTPNTCGVMGLLQSGGAFLTTLLSDLSLLQSSITTAAASLLSLPGMVVGILLSDVQTLANNLISMATGAIASMISHVTGQLTNLVNNLSLAVGQAAAQSGLVGSGCGLPSLGPSGSDCGNIQSLFGSIMGLGATLVSSAVGALAPITSTISGLLDSSLTDIAAALNTITGAVNDVAMFASQMTSMIASEVASLAAAVTDMLSFGAANSLFSLFNNPCAQQVLNTVGTPALLSQLGA